MLLHVDGRLRGEDAAALVRWEEQHDAALYPVEIIQRGNPRLYSFTKGKIDIPQRGSAFVISEREALLSTCRRALQRHAAAVCTCARSRRSS